MAKDPYRYFRIESQELVQELNEGLVALEKSPDVELVRRLLRHAHTLKGASRVVRKSDIADAAHRIEDLVAEYRDSGGPVERRVIDRALEQVDVIRGLVADLGSDGRDEDAKSPDVEEAPTRGTYDQQTIGVDVGDVDLLLGDTQAARSAAAMLRRAVERLEGGESGRRALDYADRVIAVLEELHQTASRMRLVSARTLTTALELVVRDAATTLGREVSFRATGAGTDIDAHVVAGLRRALVHVVRNAVAHGIEDRDERVRVGKPPGGKIELTIERKGHRVAVTCRDDGRGIDLNSVRDALVQRGLVTAEAVPSMGADALIEFLLRGGVSTATLIDGVSGRGVGLDAVRQAVEDLNGEVSLETERGRGTAIEIVVPISLSMVPVLPLHVGENEVLLPLDSVERAVRFDADDLSQTTDGERLVVEQTVLPYLRLRQVFDLPTIEQSGLGNAVVIGSDRNRIAIGVDRLGGTRSSVVRGIPRHAAPDPIVAGAALDDAGVPRLVLAPAALVRMARSNVTAPTPRPTAPTLPVLVIDDSLTTRMLERSILESAGYVVDLAVSAEDALKKARTKSYGLFIVDVEMPGMSGFEFIETARRDPELENIPAILVTSRGTPDDRRRGEEVGARAYIVKSEFDQARLLEAIEGLLR